MSRSPEKRRRILDSAAALFAGQPPGSVTMADVARNADVAKGTIYLYFPSKDELFEALLLEGLTELEDAVRRAASRCRDPWRRLRLAVAAAFDLQVASADAFRLRRKCESTPYAPESFRSGLRELRERFHALVRQASATGCPDAPAAEGDAAADHVLGALDTAVRRTLASGDGRPDERTVLGERRNLWQFTARVLGAPPLAARTVLVTREEGPDGPLGRELRERGAHVVRVPLVETRQPADPAPLTRAASRLEAYDWVVLTSARAAAALQDAGANGTRPSRLAVVGPATARAARRLGWEPAIVGHGGALQLVQSARDAGHSFEGASVLFAAADRARPDAVRGLEAGGATVEVVTAYRTLPREEAGPDLESALSDPPPDVVTLTSPSAAETFRKLARDWPQRIPLLAVLGSTTADAAAGIPADRRVTADHPGFAALADAIVDALHAEGS